jgi:hypothetical protein
VKKSHHVVPNIDGGWSVRRSGATKASKRFATREEAVRYGKGLAKKEQAELYIHRKDGTIREHDDYKAGMVSERVRH